LKKNIIIGGSGFVGSRVIAHLGDKYCINLDKNASPFYNHITKIMDVRDIDNLTLPSNCETVILLAAEHRDDVTPSSLYYDVNVQGTINVLNCMDKFGIKNLIFTSSVAIYGLNRDNPNEFSSEKPFNHYGVSKWNAEQVISKWYNDKPKNKSVTIIRPTVIFGERNRGNVYNLLKQISSGRFLMVGAGKNKKSMAYVENIASFIKFRLYKNEMGYHVFNYSDKPDYSMSQLVALIEKKMNIKLSRIKIPYLPGMLVGYIFDLFSILTKNKFSISSVRIKKFCATTQFDSSKALDSFKPPFTLEDGINRTLEHEFINKKEDDILFYSE